MNAIRERVIGILRRELLDRILILDERHLVFVPREYLILTRRTGRAGAEEIPQWRNATARVPIYSEGRDFGGRPYTAHGGTSHMAKVRQKKRAQRARTAAPQAEQPAGSGRGKATWTWLAGILSAVIIAAIGVVFTTWFGARGPDTFDRIGGGPPITVGYVAIEYEAQDTVLREPVTDPGERVALRASTAEKAREAVLTRHHQALIDTMNVIVTLVGNRSSLRIVDMKPRILTRGPVSDGALLSASSAGETDTIELAADLDQKAPRFTTDQDLKVPYFAKKQIDLKRDERVTLSMTISGKKAYYEFDLLVTVLAEARTEQIVINGPDKSPFRLTGAATSYRSYYGDSSLGGWEPLSGEQVCEVDPTAKGC
ncbi:hypothetical protein [Nonomuraea sp. NPDC002799]